MKLLDTELLKTNCANDESMMRELIGLGLKSLDDSITGIDVSLEEKDWDNLARILHKLRPVLCYCGINSLTDDLLAIEQNAKDKNDLDTLEREIKRMYLVLEQAQAEMSEFMALLSK